MLKTMQNLEGNTILARDIRGMGVTMTKLDNQLATLAAGQRDISSFIRQQAASGNGAATKPTATTVSECAAFKGNVQSAPNPPSASQIASSRRTLDDNVVSLITVAKVKPLIKEWLKSGPDPREEDVDFACALLLSCIYEHDALECVFSVCKMLLRKMNEEGASTIWRDALDAVIQVVQDAVEEECGHPFLLD